MSKSKTPENSLVFDGFEWTQRKDECDVEAEIKPTRPVLPVPVLSTFYTHKDHTLKGKLQSAKAFARYRLHERLL